MSHLRRYLEQTAAVAPDRLEAALRRQQIYGGSLDTVLLELAVCDPQTLCELLGQACGLEVVRPELLEDRSRPWDRVPASLQDIGWATPLAETDDNVLVAVHPDLPNERLGELYRAVPRVIPLVTPECALEKVSAERSGSVVPQRYAVLFASFMASMRERPSVTNVGFPIVPVESRVDDTAVGPRVEGPPAQPSPDPLDARPDPERITQPYPDQIPVHVEDAAPPAEEAPTEAEVSPEEEASAEDGPAADEAPDADEPPADEPRAADEPPATEDAPAAYGDFHENEPEAAQTNPRAKIVRPPSFGPPRSQAAAPPPSEPVSKAPPVRFTARGTMIATSDPLHGSFDPDEARRGVDAARSKLAEAMTRDEAIDALVEGALLFSDRVAVFRIRGDVLHGLTTPHPALAGLHDVYVPLEDGSSELFRSRRWVGTTGTGAMADAIGSAEIPCTLHRIDVAGRPVLALYVDHEGREFLPTEANLLDDLCDATAAALESILRRRRSDSMVAAVPEPPPPAPERPSPPPTFSPPPLESIAPPLSPPPEPKPEPEPEAAERPSRRPTRPPGSGEDDGLMPPPDYGVTQPPGWPSPPEPPEYETSGPATMMQRATQVDGSPMAGDLPPAPEHEAEPSAPRFVPPVLDEADDGGIIPLSSPIDQPTVRGRIMIDDEDYDDHQAPDFDDIAAIENAIRALSREEGNLDDIRALGEPGLRALASRLPGPLEVLRRDLRALPAPSAHGPLIRAAIRLGGEFVPYVLEQFNSPDPDVRFYAAFLFQELRDPRAMAALSHLAFDGGTDVRVIAMRVLETYSRYDGFEEATAVVRAELDSTHRTHQLYAARAVGTLRDVGAIPELIALLSSRDRFIQEAALESLCSITGQQHGLKPHRWKSWHQDQGSRHRVEWIIESLRHRDLPVRRWAHDELVRVTGHRVPFSPLGDRSSREVAYQAWVEWWQRHGQARLMTRVSARPRV